MAASRWTISLLAVAIAVLLEQPAAAEPESAPPVSEPIRVAEILQSLDRVEPGETWLSHHFVRLGISGKYGLTYTKHLDAGEHGVRLRFGGPVLRKINRVGLSFEVRF
jgi:hypothetical protein